MLINAAYGLGENVVQGRSTRTSITSSSRRSKQGFAPILQKTLGSKEFKLVYDIGGGKMVKNVPVPPEDRARFAIERRRDPDAGPLGLPDRGPLQRQARAPDADGHRMGEGRAAPASCSSCRRGRRRCSRRSDLTTLEIYHLKRAAARCWSRAAASARRSRRGRCA